MKRRQAARQPHPRAGHRATPLDHEVEFKLAVPEAALDAVRTEIDSLGAQAERLLTHYVDTADGRLAAAGLSLRLRQRGPRWEQTLKAADRGASFDRLEETVPLPAPAADGAPEADPSLHGSGPAAERLAAALDGADPAPRFTTDVLRRRCVLRDGATALELALDEGRIVAGERQLALHELEIELLDGSTAAALALARQWLQQHGLWLQAEAKAARGERLLQEQPSPPVVKATPPALQPRMSGEAMLRAVVRSCLAQVLPNAAAVAAGSGWSEDHVHQLRVGLRRLRTAMRELAALSDALDPAWEAPLADTFRALGVHRDSQIVRDTLPGRLRKAGAPDVAWAERQPEVDGIDPVATVRAPAFQGALLNLLGFVLQPAASPRPAAKPHLRRAMRQRLKALHERVAHDGRRFQALPADDQHKVRKRLKRLRYLSEFASPLYGEHEVAHYLARLHPAQDALGTLNDRVLAAERAADAAQAGEAGADFAVHWLAKKRKKSARKSRQALAGIQRTRPFWKGARTGK